jgi:5-methylcytosine-specific restriction endonuclease McrA
MARTSARTATANGNLGGKWISNVNRLALYLRDGFTCCYCGRDLHAVKGFDVTLDHLVCRNSGVTNHSARNLATACRSCNSARGAKPWRQYATAGAIERIERNRRRQPNRSLASAIIAERAA